LTPEWCNILPTWPAHHKCCAWSYGHTTSLAKHQQSCILRSSPPPPPGPTRSQMHMHVAHSCCLQHSHPSVCQGHKAMAIRACKLTRGHPMCEIFPYGMKCMRCGPLTNTALMSFLTILLIYLLRLRCSLTTRQQAGVCLAGFIGQGYHLALAMALWPHRDKSAVNLHKCLTHLCTQGILTLS